jgi:hypothetical protein
MARIKRSDFTRKHKHHSVAVNIRLHKDGGAKPSRAEVEKVIRSIMRNGVVPTGWKFNAIDWRRPGWSAGYWRTGDIRDMMGNLSQVLPFMLDNARIGLVRGTLYEIEVGMKY